MSEILNKKLALFGILWAALQAARRSSALFESCKCSILGMGLFGKNGFQKKVTMRQASEFAQPIRVHPPSSAANFVLSKVFDFGNGTVWHNSQAHRFE
jgi:hypothetical protein